MVQSCQLSNMKLLDAFSVKKEHNRGVEELRDRVLKLASEEAEIVKRVANARDSEKKEIDGIEQNLIRARARHQEEIGHLATEVNILERRRAAALEPITTKEKEVIRFEESVVQREKDITQREEATEQARVGYME